MIRVLDVLYLNCNPAVHAWRSLPRSGHTNRDEANAYVCPLTSLICKSNLNLNTFASADRITSSGKSFHGSTILDVKLCLHNSSRFLFLYSFMEFLLPGLLLNLKKSVGYVLDLSFRILYTWIISAR